MTAQDARELVFQTALREYDKVLNEIRFAIQTEANKGRHQLKLEYISSASQDMLNCLVQFFIMNGYHADLLESKNTIVLLIDWDARGYKGTDEEVYD